MKKRNYRLAMWAFILLIGLLTVGCANKQEAPQQEAPKKTRIVFVSGGGQGDKSYHDAAYQGLERARKQLGDKLDLKYLELRSSDNREQVLRLLAQEKYDLIFALGYSFTEPVRRVAEEFPATKFALAGEAIPDLDESPNLSSLVFRDEEGAFLVGTAAALQSKTGKIGFIGGIPMPLIERLEAGYVAGAKTVNPQINVLTDYIGYTSDAFNNPETGKELAQRQLHDGADVIFHAAGASGIAVLETVTEQKKYAIGVGLDQSLTMPDSQKRYVLTSMIRRLDRAVFNMVKSVVEQSFKGGYYEYGLKDGAVGYAQNEFNKVLLNDSKLKLDEWKAKIEKGEISIPATKKELKNFLEEEGE